MKKNSFNPENQAGSERGTVMNRLFDTSVNVGLRQFYVLGAAGSIGNLFGFIGNVYIYGLSAPTIFCALCTLVIFGMTFWGIRSRHVKRAAYVIITLITFFEFPILYYIYQTGCGSPPLGTILPYYWLSAGSIMFMLGIGELLEERLQLPPWRAPYTRSFPSGKCNKVWGTRKK